MGEELLAAQDLVRVLEEGPQELELPGAQLDVASAPSSGAQVEGDAAGLR